MTKTKSIAYKGKSALKVICECASHAGNGNAAVLTGRTASAVDALKGKKRDERIHGFVLLANHPAQMMRSHNERQGIFAA